jgi:putative transposase
LPNSFAEVYLHFVWTTWDRLPLITADIEPRIYALIADKCAELRCQLIEIGGVEDHIHVLVRMPAAMSPAQLAHGMKGSSSHLATHALGKSFKWRGSYGVLSVSPNQVTRVRAYIRNQKQHHRSGEVHQQWEQDFEPTGP